MLSFVADVSAVCAWCFEDERSEASEALLARLPEADIRVPALFVWELANVLSLAAQHRLTSYDAAYLELAMRAGLPLASRDNGLIGAARTCGLALLAC